MSKKYVMANLPNGSSEIVAEEPIAQDNAVDLWINHETPADLTGNADPTKGVEFLHEPPDGGAIFRIVRFTREMNDVTPEQAFAMHQALNSVHVPTLEELRAAKHPSMHKTDTLNYFVLLSGRLWMLSEGKDILLEPGDCVIQKGCMHGWRVEGEETAVLGCVLIDARPA